MPSTDPRVVRAQRSIGRTGWAAYLLDLQFPDGHWTTAKTSGRDLYVPKYIVTNWHAIVLAELGATRKDPRIRKTAELILRRWKSRKGDFAGNDGEICIVANAVRTLIRFGFLEHPVVQKSIDWIVRDQKSDGGWHCFPSRSGTLDGWEGLAALAEIPSGARTDAVRRSIERGAEFFLERRLMREGKTRYAPWFRIHYPNHYYYDVFVGLRMLARLGYGRDPRLRPALRWLRGKRRPDGTWALDADHPDLDARVTGQFDHPVFPFRIEAPNEASRWATVEALSVLNAADDA